MKFRWILLLFFILIFAFQSKNILTFAGVELGAYLGFKDLDKNSSGFIEKEEWSQGMFSLLDFEKRVSNSSWSIKEMQLTHNKNKLASHLYELSIDAIAAQDYERARHTYNQALKLNNQLHQSALSKSINEGIKKPNQNAILDRQTSLLNALNLALEKYDYDQIINLQSILTNAPFKGPAVKRAIKQANAARQKQAKQLDKQADAVYRQGKVTDAIKLWKEAEKLAPSLTAVQDKLARANRVHKKLIKLRAFTEQ